MTTKSLVRFEEALKSADSYYRSAVNARNKQYDFLARAYIAYREGQRHKTEYARMLELRLGHEPTGVQKARPLLCLVRALFGEEHTRARHSLPKYSKLAGALHTIHNHFATQTPHQNKIIDHIRLHGGVAGLYEKYQRSKRADLQNAEDTPLPPPPDMVSVPPSSDLVSIPRFGLNIRRSGSGYKLVLSDIEPGTYIARLHVGDGGVVKEWRVESKADPVFKPVLKTA